MLNMEKLTIKAKEALQKAHDMAAQKDNQQIHPLHLLRALLLDTEGAARSIISKAGADPGALEQRVDEEADKLPKITGAGEVYLSKELNNVFDRSDKRAKELGDEFI
ncbi:MAG TPA: Clp protease N-terminal domain-containing protein, partial [Spirochaetota bacterium]|nr:Clp protease N-terminal domain-containing protein [Spirochaetota bacterium]